MPGNFQSIATNTVYANETPMAFLIGSTPIFNFIFLGTGILTAQSDALYRSKLDVSVAQLTGSSSISGRTVTTRQLLLNNAGDYELYVSVSDGTINRVKALRIYVRKLGAF